MSMRFILFAMLASTVACGSSSQQTNSQKQPTPSPQPVGGGTGGTPAGSGGAGNPNYINPPGQPYTFVGRFDMSNPAAPVMALEGSKVGATFTGSSLAVTLSDTGDDYFNVVIDGGAPIVIESNSASPTTVSIANNLSAGTHTVWMTKRTEFLQYNAAGTDGVGSTTFHGFASNGTFQNPPTPSSRHIEFIGDSAYTGYGVDQLDTTGKTVNCFEPSTESSDESIPGYTGKLLNADIVNDSWSGEAVYLSVFDPNPAHDLPVIYPDTLPPNGSPAWNFSNWVADVVVIGAGGDDLAGNDGSGYFPDSAAFQNAYLNWLVEIRHNYPNAVIICVLSPSAIDGDIATLGGALQSAVGTRNAAGDGKVYYFDYFSGTPYGGYNDAASALNLYWACAGHPSAAGAQWLAQQLANFIRTKISW